DLVAQSVGSRDDLCLDHLQRHMPGCHGSLATHHEDAQRFDHAVPAPPRHLDAITSAAPNHEHVTAEGILQQRVRHDGGQTIEVAAHAACSHIVPYSPRKYLVRQLPSWFG